ncbi:MAG: hypothetical protein HY290_25120, partial [Planctomycetia bacterium]|nr:hypothetical protein [Planctomycetia bacterium]
MYSRKRQPEPHPRRGTVAVLAALLMVALVGMVAFSVDLSYLSNSKAELQRSADSAALAAAYKLIYTGTPGTPVNLSANLPQVPTTAATYAAANP